MYKYQAGLSARFQPASYLKSDQVKKIHPTFVNTHLFIYSLSLLHVYGVCGRVLALTVPRPVPL